MQGKGELKPIKFPPDMVYSSFCEMEQTRMVTSEIETEWRQNKKGNVQNINRCSLVPKACPFRVIYALARCIKKTKNSKIPIQRHYTEQHVYDREYQVQCPLNFINET